MIMSDYFKRKNYQKQAIGLFLFFIFLKSASSVFAQDIPIGTWRTHFNYSNAKDLEIAGNKIYCVTSNGFFYYDNAAGETFRLSRIDGLSESLISKIKYSQVSKTLIIAYKSGNIDLLSLNDLGEPGNILNIPLLKETAQIQGNKEVNHIEIKDKTAFLAYDFGLVVLDLDRQDIRETYQNLGDNGSEMAVYRSTIANDSIYLTSSQGVRAAPFSSNINLQYYGNWKGISARKYKICNSNTGLLAIFDGEGIFKLEKGKFTKILAVNDNLVNAAFLNKYSTLSFSNGSVFLVNADGKIETIKTPFSGNPQQSLVDPAGKLWIADAVNGLVGNASGSFKSYSPVSNDTLFHIRKDSIIADADMNLWIRLGYYQGILVKNTKNQSRYLSTADGSGKLPNGNVNTLSLDKDGQIWVGTSNGVAVFDNPTGAFDGGSFNAYTPVFERRRLLNNQVVTAIAIDGGNRKWIGTQNGIFLFNADATELVTNFTDKNSPLPSNEIQYITVEPVSGEVYIRTTNGLVSYRGTASEGSQTQDQNAVKVFPNPVRPDFNGTVGISGLVEDAYVKITDANGRLVYETRANGGTAVWNGRMLNGDKVATGVYMIFSFNRKGEETLVSRLAVIK